MKAWGVLTVAILLSFPMSCYADEINIPFGVKNECFKAAMLLRGYDLEGSDESDGDSGFRDGMFKVNIYRAASINDLNSVKECAFQCKR